MTIPPLSDEQRQQARSAATEARLRVPIAAVYPLAQASKAHARLAEGHIPDRIVLRTNPD